MAVEFNELSLGNWRAVIDTLLGNLNIKYEIQILNDEIIIKAEHQDSQKIQQKLQETLQSPEHFFNQLPYSVLTENFSSRNINQNTRQYPQVKPPEDTVDSGISIFKNLFSEETIKGAALDVDALFDVNKGARSTGQVLYSMPAKNKVKGELWNKILEVLLLSFHNVNIKTLREIWANKGHYLPKPGEMGDDSENEVIFSGLAQQCFGVLEENNPSSNTATHVKLYFDYGLLYRFIFPPQIDNTSVGIKIQKKHLFHYVRMLISGGGPLIRVYKKNGSENQNGNGEDQLMAMPIFLAPEKVQYQRHHYTAIIDHSGSMISASTSSKYKSVLDQIKNDILVFIKKLQEFDSQAKIKIVFFDDITESKEFDISQTYEISSYIAQFHTRGGTRLLGTIQDELTSLLKDQITKNYNSAVVLLTDGEDTAAVNRADALNQIGATLSQFKIEGRKLPKFFTMGVGISYDKDVLVRLADKTGTPFIHLHSVEDFKDIYRYLNSIQYEQQLMDFLVKTGDSRHYSVPVSMDGNAHTTGILIPFQKKETLQIKTNGRQIAVFVDDPAKVPMATTDLALLNIPFNAPNNKNGDARCEALDVC